MKIYGVALLAACFLIGKLLGNLLGILINIDGDVGGVGFAMILFDAVQRVDARERLDGKGKPEGHPILEFHVYPYCGSHGCNSEY